MTSVTMEGHPNKVPILSWSVCNLRVLHGEGRGRRDDLFSTCESGR